MDADDTFNIATGESFYISTGAFAGSGSLVNNGTFNGTTLYFVGGGTISGTGTTNLNGGNDSISDLGNGLVTIGAGQTIAGAGSVGLASNPFTNQGTVTANQNGNTLTLQTGANYAFTNTGSGAARAENGGTLVLTTGTFSGGTFTALTGSQVQVTNGAVISGATLASSGTGTVTMNNATLTNTTLSGSVSVPNGGGVTLNGTLTNNGTFTLNSTGDNVSLVLGSPTTISGTGTINLSGPGGRISAANTGDLLTIGSGQTITGAGNLGGGSTTINNEGFLGANVNGGTLTIQPSSGTGTFVNQSAGTVGAGNGGTMVLTNNGNGTFTNQGTFLVGANGTLTVSPGALTNFSGTTLTGGFYFVDSASAAAPATLSFGGGSIVTNNAGVYLNGPGAVFNEINALANNASNGAFYLSSGHDFTTAGALTNSGELTVGASKLTIAGSLDNSGETSVASMGTITVQGNVTNSGRLNAQSGTLAIQGTLNSSGSLFTQSISSNGVITSTGALTVTSTGAVYGNGSMTAPSLALGGTVFPGNTPYNAPIVGTLTLNGQVGMLASTSLVFDLAGTAASDQIQVNGALTLAGTLTVNALAGFGAGHYDLINYTGALTNNGLALGTVPSGYNYAIDTSRAGEVDLVVTNVVPEPSTWALLVAGAGLLGVGAARRRQVHFMTL